MNGARLALGSALDSPMSRHPLQPVWRLKRAENDRKQCDMRSESTRLSPAVPHIVILPDHDVPVGVAPAGERTEVVPYPSGRPWIVVADRRSERLLVVRTRHLSVALIGHFSVTDDELERTVSEIRDVADLDDVGIRVSGSYHLLATDGRLLRAQGTASGTRRLFYTRGDDLTIAADRADVLAALVQARVDTSLLALRLVHPVPYPFTESTVWREVEGLAPGEALILDSQSRTLRGHTWWQPPEPTVHLREGAAELREALVRAVRARTLSGTLISSDLSGGMDSTPVCYLAAENAHKTLAVTYEPADPAADDMKWARMAADHMNNLRHVTLDAKRVPQFFGGLLDIRHTLDGPSLTLLGQPRFQVTLDVVSRHGSTRHLTGIGGDLVLSGSPTYCHDLIRRNPLKGLRRLRSYRLTNGWPLWKTLRSAVRNESYGRWLSTQLSPRQPANRLQALEWGISPAAPSWATDEMVGRIRGLLHLLGPNIDPLHRLRGSHWDVFGIRLQSQFARALDQVGGHHGVSVSSPLLDDQVVNTCLSVKPEERITPWEFKPLIKAAMRPVMPPEILQRTTKSIGSMEAAIGLASNKQDILELWNDSRLGQLGLVDVEKLRMLTLNPTLPEVQKDDGAILRCAIVGELWLRKLTALDPASLAVEMT
jgi:asparagine synthase (glutamine-hydrolysing)